MPPQPALSAIPPPSNPSLHTTPCTLLPPYMYLFGDCHRSTPNLCLPPLAPCVGLFGDRRPDAEKNEEELRHELGQLRDVWRMDQAELTKLHTVRQQEGGGRHTCVLGLGGWGEHMGVSAAAGGQLSGMCTGWTRQECGMRQAARGCWWRVCRIHGFATACLLLCRCVPHVQAHTQPSCSSTTPLLPFLTLQQVLENAWLCRLTPNPGALFHLSPLPPAHPFPSGRC